ncbi:MAG: Cys-tRNA(Pro) deacylase [Bacteroidetes bacterium]|nr:MAG: Cys-tRNA(Pro) deacylase [Bacteroidota bacterium]
MDKTNAMRLLEKHGIAYDAVPYRYDEADLSVARIAALNDLPEARIFKTLVVRGDKSGPVLAVIPGDASLSFKKLAQASGNRKMRMAPPDELPALTGYVRGGCSPLGTRRALPVFIDAAALDHPRIYVNGGRKGLLLHLAPDALIRLTGATVAPIVSPSPKNHP